MKQQWSDRSARRESPFLVQAEEVRAYIARHGADPAAADDGHLEVLLDQCDGYVAAVRKRSPEAGVGVNLVFLLARIEQVTGRLRRLRDLISPVQAAASDATVSTGRSNASRHDHVLDFFVQIVRQENRRNSMRDLMSGTTELLARHRSRPDPGARQAGAAEVSRPAAGFPLAAGGRSVVLRLRRESPTGSGAQRLLYNLPSGITPGHRAIAA